MIEQHKQTMNLGKNGEFREEWQLMSDVTQRSSDWSRAGEIPAEDVRGWTPWLQLGVVCVCVRYRRVGGGGSCPVSQLYRW